MAPVPQTLSICMIVKNEADFLARCLQSIRPAADQIVVVDTGSQDRTSDVARSFGANVVSAEWRNDFSWARNISLDHASGAWILWLDADDVVPADSIPRLLALKKEKPDRVFGLIVRNERPNNTGTEFVQARMFPNRPGIRFERRVHEQMMPSAIKLGLSMEKKDVVIEHHGYADPATLKRKAGRNIDLMRNEYDAGRPDPVTAVEIADSCQLIESWDEAEKWYRAVLAVGDVEKASPALASQAYLGLGSIANRLEKYDKAIEYLNKSVELASWRTDALYVLAVAYDLKGATDEAIACLRRILKAKPSPGQVGVDFRSADVKAMLRLQRILAEQGRMSEAIAESQHAIAAHADRPEVFVMAGKVLLANNSLMEALKLFERSIMLTVQGNIDSYIGLCIIFRKANKMETARQSLESVRPIFSDMPKYWAFRKYFLNEKDGIPAKYSEQDLEKEWGNIKKEFFNIF